MPHNTLVRVCEPHPWPATPAEAIALQGRLAPRVLAEGGPEDVRLVAGCDLAFLDGGPFSARRGGRESAARGAVVLLSYPDLSLVESHAVEERVAFPYVPGLLAFREAPVLLRAFEKIERTPDLLLVDGHGFSHPRRFGIACHLGLLLDVPTIGIGKSRLIGEHGEPGSARGARAELRHEGAVIGLVLRARDRVAPLYVSVGHRIGLHEAAEWTLRLCRGYRLPEPVRLADQLSKGRALQPSRRPAV